MNQLSIIYFIMGSVLLVSVMLISISPANIPPLTQKGAGSGEVMAAGYGKISFYPADNKGRLNDKSKFETAAAANPLGIRIMTTGPLGNFIRRLKAEGVFHSRLFLLQAH